jgi:hypothetical protein
MAQAAALRQRFTTIPIAVDTAELTPIQRQPNAQYHDAGHAQLPAQCRRHSLVPQ